MITNTDKQFHEQVARRAIDSFRETVRAAQADPSAADPQLRELYAANAPLLADTQAAHSCGGSFSWAAAVIWGTLNTTPTLDFQDWGRLTFAGTHWGAGFGGGTSYTVGFSTVSPGEVIGDVNYVMGFAPGIPGVVTITFFRNGKLLVSVSGPTLSVGTGAFYGTGKFQRA